LNYFYVDPSLNVSGYAITSDGNLFDKGLIKVAAKLSEQNKLKEISTQIQSVLNKITINYAFVEVIASFSYARSVNQYSGKGVNQGALHKLNRAIGCIVTTLVTNDIDVLYVFAHQWKGSLGKDAVMKITGETNNHIADAVMMSKIIDSPEDFISKKINTLCR